MECAYCPRRCLLQNNVPGTCGAYYAEQGEIKEKYPHRWTVMYAVHIESVPFYHAYPGSRSFLFGSSGCNLDCAYCSNAYVAKGDPSDLFTFNLPPAKLVDLAQKTGCHNIVFGINEPLVSLPSLRELAVEAKSRNIPMGCLTNGYMSEESAREISALFSFINVSLKSLSNDFYRDLTGVLSVQPVLDSIKYFSERNHLEITTPIIQGINDDEIEMMADFIAGINPAIPWHVFRLLPEYKMKDHDYPHIMHINRKLEEVRKKLPFIYFSNFAGSRWVNTLCPQCREIVIERINFSGCGGKVVDYKLQGNRCPFCGGGVPIHGQKVSWNSMDEDYRGG
ncbi:MAG TPA: radical SAM protein [Bacillota bacterium]|nr:radical SAM protein [Bacillota bacterium]